MTKRQQSMDTDGPVGRKPRKPARATTPFKPYTFVQLSLREADKEAIREGSIDIDRLFDWLESRAEEGYKFSLRYDDKQDAMLVSLTAAREGMTDFSRVLTSRHPELLTALTTLVYKFDVMLQGGPLPGADETNSSLPIWD